MNQLDRAIAFAKRRLEKKVAEDPEATIQPQVTLFKDGDPVLILLGDDARTCARLAEIAMTGFQGDEITMLTDTHFANSPTNPEGKPWYRGEMQERKHEPAVAAVLQEALMILHVDRQAKVTGSIRGYVRRGRTVAWKSDPLGEPDELDGVIPDLLIKAMRSGSLLDQAGIALEKVEEVFKLDAQEIAYHTKIATVRFLLAQIQRNKLQVSVAMAAHSVKETEAIRASLGRLDGFDVEILKPSQGEGNGTAP